MASEAEARAERSAERPKVGSLCGDGASNRSALALWVLLHDRAGDASFNENPLFRRIGGASDVIDANF